MWLSQKIAQFWREYGHIQINQEVRDRPFRRPEENSQSQKAIVETQNQLQAEKDKDKHWNDLNYYELDDILENHIFKKYIAPEGWNSENPPLLCKKHCSNK